MIVTQSAAEGHFFEPYQNDPVFSHGDQGSWFEDSVEPGTIIFHDGKFHMFFSGIKNWPAKVSIGYATSTGDIRWALDLGATIRHFKGRVRWIYLIFIRCCS